MLIKTVCSFYTKSMIRDLELGTHQQNFQSIQDEEVCLKIRLAIHITFVVLTLRQKHDSLSMMLLSIWKIKFCSYRSRRKIFPEFITEFSTMIIF